MKSKFLKKTVSVIISMILVVACIPSAFAVLSEKEVESYHTPGGFFVTLSSEAPVLGELLAGYEIEFADLIKTTVSREGYCEVCSVDSLEDDIVSEGDIVMLTYHIWLVDETEEMLKEVVTMLLSNSYVYGAVVNNYKPKETVTTSPTTPEITVPTPTMPVIVEPTAPAIPESVKYHPGRVIVSVRGPLAGLFEGFEVASVRLLTPGSASESVYLVEFSEKTYEIVWEAIEILIKNPCVIDAEPDYIGEWCVEPGDKDQYPLVVDHTERTSVGEHLPVVVPVMGDANYDGELTIKDATCIQKCLAGLSVLVCGDEYTSAAVVADIDTDGDVTIKDATAIQKKIAGLA